MAFGFGLFDADTLELIIEEFGGSMRSCSDDGIPDLDVIGLTFALVAGVTEELFDCNLALASLVASFTS